MELLLNGNKQILEGVNTAGDVLAHLKIPRERVAVVINEQVIRRVNLDATPVSDGDTVEIITMVGGG